MCGRFTYRFTWKQLHRLLQLVDWPNEELRPRYNVAPTQTAPIVRASEAGRVGAMLRWGLVPFWAEDPNIGQKMINARAESVATKPAFRSAFARRRCLVPVSGFYEWQKVGGGKQPFVIERDDSQPFMLAGLWERWAKSDEPMETFTIITTEPNELIRPVHNRMPVILHERDFEAWLDPQASDVESLQSLLRPAEMTGFRVRPVSRRVNSPANDDASILEGGDDALFTA